MLICISPANVYCDPLSYVSCFIHGRFERRGPRVALVADRGLLNYFSH
jgi:hypothetical protein